MEIFLVCPPGFEPSLAQEAQERGFSDVRAARGGVSVEGGWEEVWRANLQLRGAARVLVRVGSFMAFHLAQLDKRARKFNWGALLRADVPVRVEVTCKASKIYHAKAAAQRIETALREAHGLTVSAEADLLVKLRIARNEVTISLDSSGTALHQRGHKQAVGKAPMRENLAALFLRACGYRAGEPLVDFMCGSGTFVIEAAEIAAGLWPGRTRGFAFEHFASFDAARWAAMKAADAPCVPEPCFFGSDRDQGAVAMSTANAARAGVAACCTFSCAGLSEARPPDGPAGLVILNPPYGARIGNKKPLFALYGTMGEVLKAHFAGWRVGVVTSDDALAKATGLPWRAGPLSVPHGGLKVRLWQTGAL
ncbi:MAG: class I SAM-dependent RNA methyltransferase [Pseudomonadota bacterium]